MTFDTLVTIIFVVLFGVSSLCMLIAPHFTYVGNRSRRYIRPGQREKIRKEER